METETNEKSPILPQAGENGYSNNHSEENHCNYDSLVDVAKSPSSSPKKHQNQNGDSNSINDNNVPSKSHSTQNGSGISKGDLQVQVYKRRWYILAVFCLFANIQTAVWQTWGPISDTSERVFGWTDSTIAWLNNFGPVAYSVAGILFPWLLQVKGLRAAILGSALLMSFGCTCRVISSDPHTASILIHIGQLLNGASGPMAMGAMPYLSATWFPVHERVTATAIGSCVGYFGSALSFVIGPALVSDSGINRTNVHGGGSSFEHTNKTDYDAVVDKEKHEILRYMYYECGVAWFVTIIIIAYFPAKPPFPPCVSAGVQRDNFWRGIFSLRRNRYFIMIAVAYGMSVGVTNAWVTVLNITLGQFGLSQISAGWIGFYATVSSCTTGVIVGKFADYFTRMMKIFILIMYAFGAAFLVTFTLMYIKVIPYNNVFLWVSVICGMTAVNGAVPMLFELACEMAFPTGEGPTTGVLTYINNVFGLIFLALFSIPDIGRDWMNWFVVAATVLCLPLIGFMRGRMRRLDIDEDTEENEEEEA